MTKHVLTIAAPFSVIEPERYHPTNMGNTTAPSKADYGGCGGGVVERCVYVNICRKLHGIFKFLQNDGRQNDISRCIMDEAYMGKRYHTQLKHCHSSQNRPLRGHLLLWGGAFVERMEGVKFPKRGHKPRGHDVTMIAICGSKNDFGEGREG